MCGNIVFYKLRSKSGAAIEHNITIYLMAKYCKIYHLYIVAFGPETGAQPSPNAAVQFDGFSTFCMV